MEELLTANEVKQIFKLSLQGTYRAARERQIPVIYIGRQMRFPKSAIQEWIANQVQPVAAQKTAT